MGLQRHRGRVASGIINRAALPGVFLFVKVLLSWAPGIASAKSRQASHRTACLALSLAMMAVLGYRVFFSQLSLARIGRMGAGGLLQSV